MYLRAPDTETHSSAKAPSAKRNEKGSGTRMVIRGIKYFCIVQVCLFPAICMRKQFIINIYQIVGTVIFARERLRGEREQSRAGEKKLVYSWTDSWTADSNKVFKISFVNGHMITTVHMNWVSTVGLLLRVSDANENTLFIHCFVSHCVIV